MSLRNQLIKLRKTHPNDQEFGLAVNELILATKTCCDNKDNHVHKKIEDEGPYGYWGTQIDCKVCGKMLDFELK